MRLLAFAGIAVAAIGLSACTSGQKPMTTAAPAAAAPKVYGEILVSDQRLRRGTVTIQHIEIDAPGFVVIHETTPDGKPIAPGSIGYAKVNKGDNDRVVVRLTKPVKRGAKLFAMLHYDTGKMGTYEFGPNATAEDKPVIMNGAPIMTAFSIQ